MRYADGWPSKAINAAGLLINPTGPPQAAHHQADPSVAEIDQMLCRRPGTGTVIDVDTGDAVDWLLVDKDDRKLAAQEEVDGGSRAIAQVDERPVHRDIIGRHAVRTGARAQHAGGLIVYGPSSQAVIGRAPGSRLVRRDGPGAGLGRPGRR
jgi:hypothetical protein